MKSIHTQTGLSLIEIMVALVISLFLLGGIGQVYLGNKSTYGFSDAISRVQENGRFALDSITQDLRMGGFFGCVPIQSDKNGNGLRDENPKIQNFLNKDSDNYLAARYDFLDTPAITATNDDVNGSDTITIKGAKPEQNPLVEELSTPGSASLRVASSSSFEANDIILITNCYGAKIFEISNAEPDPNDDSVTILTHDTSVPENTPGNINLNSCTDGSHCLLNEFDYSFKTTNSAAFALQAVRYYIGISDSGSGEPALRRVLNGVDDELIEGVEQMQLLFGEETDAVDPDGSPNRYVTSGQVTDMNKVVAIRVALVVRSDRANLLDADQTYQIFGTNQTATDGRVRQVFSSTIMLRNNRATK